MPQKVVCDDSCSGKTALNKAELTKKLKINHDQKLIQAAG